MALDQHGVLLKMVVIVSQHHLTGRLCWSWLSWFICLSTRLWAVPLQVSHLRIAEGLIKLIQEPRLAEGIQQGLRMGSQRACLRRPSRARLLRHRTQDWGGAALSALVLDMRRRTAYGRTPPGRRRSRDHWCRQQS